MADEQQETQNVPKDRNGEALLAAFLDNTLSPEEMSHENHLFLAWLLLKRHPLPEAMILYRDGLLAFTARLGLKDKYHETLTFLMLMLIYDRMPGCEAFDDFLKGNPELTGNWRTTMESWYGEGVLFSKMAAERLVLPIIGRCSGVSQQATGDVNSAQV